VPFDSQINFFEGANQLRQLTWLQQHRQQPALAGCRVHRAQEQRLEGIPLAIEPSGCQHDDRAAAVLYHPLDILDPGHADDKIPVVNGHTLPQPAPDGEATTRLPIPGLLGCD